MKLKILNKIISVSLIIIMISHLTILHHILQDYVLCNGADGHVAIENVNECESCSNISSFTIFTLAGQSFTDVDGCQDTRLDENCIDENEFIPKNRINLNVDLVYTSETNTPTQNEWKKYKFTDKDFCKENHILKNYTTVSLLI